MTNRQGVSITPHYFIALLGKHWLACAGGALFGAVFGLALTYVQTPQYQAEVILAPSAAQGTGSSIGSILGPLQGMAGLALGLGGEGGQSLRAVTVMRSRAFTEKFVASHDIAGELDTPGLVGRFLHPNGNPIEGQLYRTARLFRTDVQAIRLDPKTGFLTVGMRWRDPRRAAEWANEVSAAINEEMRARSIEEADRALTYLQKELTEQTAVEVRLAINKLIESQLRNKMMANTQPEFVYTVLEPALPPHVDDFVSPNRPLVTATSAVLGFLIAIVVFMRRKP